MTFTTVVLVVAMIVGAAIVMTAMLVIPVRKMKIRSQEKLLERLN